MVKVVDMVREEDTARVDMIRVVMVVMAVAVGLGLTVRRVRARRRASSLHSAAR